MDYLNFTVFFEEPFWVGVFERNDAEGYSVARVVFGPEPTEAQIFNYLLENYPHKVLFSHSSIEEPINGLNQSPKRRHREAKALLAKQGTSTKAQEAVKTAYEMHKQVNRKNRRLKKEIESEVKYQKKMEKKKQKKRGR